MVASYVERPLAERRGASFNPLHCGAVVASLRHIASRPRRLNVSIPFIAGQWSLPAPRSPYGWRGPKFQSPSLRGSGRFPILPRTNRWVAMAFQSPSLRGSGRFMPLAARRVGKGGFQSPSLRGSGRFPSSSRKSRSVGSMFQSPSLRGSGRFPRRRTRRSAGRRFNPLHCGAVVASVGESSVRH